MRLVKDDKPQIMLLNILKATLVPVQSDKVTNKDRCMAKIIIIGSLVNGLEPELSN